MIVWYLTPFDRKSREFNADAVALWRASEGRRTFKAVASELNVNPET